MTSKEKTRIFRMPPHSAPELCVALANSTLPARAPEGRRKIAPRTPRLQSFADLVHLTRRHRALAAADGETLLRMAEADPAAADAVLGRAREMQAFVAELCRTLAAGRPPSPTDVETIDAFLAETRPRTRLVLDDENELTWYLDAAGDLDQVLWLIAWSAAELVLTCQRNHRIRLCAAKDCHRLFYERSNNGKQRWCEMRTCGNIVKSRRFGQGRRKR